MGAARRAKGARDARYTMYVSDAEHVGARVVAGYLLGIVLGMGVVGVWLGMFLDWLVRGICFWRRLISGKWLQNTGLWRSRARPDFTAAAI